MLKLSIQSLIAGTLVGAFYGAIDLSSPAPPLWALAGLLGMLAGQALIHWLKSRS